MMLDTLRVNPCNNGVYHTCVDIRTNPFCSLEFYSLIVGSRPWGIDLNDDFIHTQ